MTAESAESRTYRLSPRLSVTFTLGMTAMCCEWDPEQPTALTAVELERYRSARNEMVERLSKRRGINALVVEI